MSPNQIVITAIADAVNDLKDICDIIEYKDKQTTKLDISKVIINLVDTMRDYQTCETELPTIRMT
jgi:hypothetical protein